MKDTTARKGVSQALRGIERIDNLRRDERSLDLENESAQDEAIIALGDRVQTVSDGVALLASVIGEDVGELSRGQEEVAATVLFLAEEYGEHLVRLSERIAALEGQPVESKPEVTDAERVEASLRFLIETETNATFDYLKPGEQYAEPRLVSPYGITDGAERGTLLLLGYDLDREGIRQFRLDRISQVAAGEVYEFRPAEHD